MNDPNVHAPTRNDFMHHAYNALYTGNIVNLPNGVAEMMIANVMKDVCTFVRSMPKEKQDQFLADVVQQIRTN